MGGINEYSWLWVIGLGVVTVGFAGVQKWRQFRNWLVKKYPQSLWVIAGIYMVYALLLPGEVNDVALFGSVGFYLSKKIDFYFIDSSHGTFPFLPLMAMWYYLAYLITQAVGMVKFSGVVKLLLIPTAAWLASRLKRPAEALSLLLNPVLFSAVVFHGQPDILLITLMLIATWRVKTPVVAGLAYGLSILVKSWSVMLMPMWLVTMRLKQLVGIGVGVVSVVTGVVFAYTRIWGSSFTTVFRAATGHPAGSGGYWGISAIAPSLANLKWWNGVLVGLLVVIQVWAAWKGYSRIKIAKLALLTFTVFTRGWGIQYALWVLPFAYFDADIKRATRYSLLAVPYLLLSYGFTTMQTTPGWGHQWLRYASILPWGYAAWWLYNIMSAEIAQLAERRYRKP